MDAPNNKLFFETPKDKLRVFQKPRLLMFSEGNEVQSWDNTQPLYFYPFSWLDYLNKTGIREVYVIDSSAVAVKDALDSLRSPGKVHFESPDIDLIKIAKDLGHRVSVICNLEELASAHIPILAETDSVKVRVARQKDLALLSGLPNAGLLSCIKVYVGENCDYARLAVQARDMGFNLFHVAKRLVTDENSKLSEQEREVISKLMELESKDFKVITPSSLDEKFARRFLITPQFSNVTSCNFSKYRLVLNKDGYYPCYTKQILAHEGLKKGEVGSPKNCLDCACIYENDMLSDIEDKMIKYKRPSFALEYQDDR